MWLVTGSLSMYTGIISIIPQMASSNGFNYSGILLFNSTFNGFKLWIQDATFFAYFNRYICLYYCCVSDVSFVFTPCFINSRNSTDTWFNIRCSKMMHCSYACESVLLVFSDANLTTSFASALVFIKTIISLISALSSEPPADAESSLKFYFSNYYFCL